MKKMCFYLSLCIILLSFTSNVFAENISDSFENTSDNVIIDNIVIGEPESSKEILDLKPECEIASGSAVKLIDEEYDNINYVSDTRASKPDLLVSGLSSVGTYPFKALNDSVIEIKISNRGNAAANNFYFSVYADGNYIGKGQVDSLAAGYVSSMNITFSNVREGTHTVKVVVDEENKISESNESNNSMTKSFVWKGTPDFTTEIVGGPAANSEVEGGDEANFKFYVRNIGNGDAANVPVIIMHDELYVHRIIESLPAKTSVCITGTVNFGGYGNTYVGINVNNERSITESNYSNNMSRKLYYVKYCLHFLGCNKFSASDAKKIKFFVTSSAKEYFPDIDFDRFSEWNNVTDNVVISRVNTKSSADFFVEAIELKKESTLGYTVEDLRTIQLNIKKGSLIDEPLERQNRTYLHEMGHALGLAHPRTESTEPSCGYTALMCQTWDSEYIAFEPTYHDKYNLMKLYE